MSRAEEYDHQRREQEERAEMFERCMALPAYRALLDLLEAQAKLRLEELLVDSDARPGKLSDAYLKGLIYGLRWPAALGSHTMQLVAQLRHEEDEEDDDRGQ